MKIGIYGGSFDPPHIGHEMAAKRAVSALHLDKLLVIPTALSPFKAEQGASATREQRLKMTKKAMADIKHVKVSDLELKRGGTSYTYETILALRKKYPDDEFYLLLGTDMVQSFGRWREYPTILKECTLAAMLRSEGEAETVKECLTQLEDEYGARTVLFSTEVTEASSTQIRSLLKKRQGRELLNEDVYAYIIKHRLYDARPELEWLRKQAYAMLKPKRIPHVMGCEEEAARLALRWGEDENDAREAAIMHDITKKEDLDGQLNLCRKYGIITDDEEKTSAALLHSKTGAAVAQNEFGAPERVVNAIKWHTTGKANMTLLEKIIYLADFIEPTRSFDGLEEVRQAAYKDLNRALILAFNLSLEDMQNRGIKPHANTVSARNYLLETTKDREE